MIYDDRWIENISDAGWIALIFLFIAGRKMTSEIQAGKYWKFEPIGYSIARLKVLGNTRLEVIGVHV